jgi:mono/diheme cytochrome c family protein
MTVARLLTFFASSFVYLACSSTPQGQNPDLPATGETSGGTSTAPPSETGATPNATATTAPSTSPSTTPSTVPTTDPQALAPSAERGQKLFAENTCTACHGTADKPKKNIFTIKWSDARKAHAINTIKKGKSPMPAYGDKFSDAELADLLAFLGYQ